jgi:hypothetical protein
LATVLLLASCAPGRDRSASSTTETASTGFTERFDGLEPASQPPGWEALETNGRGTPGRWRVESGDETGGRFLRLSDVANEANTYNLLLVREPAPADLRLTVRIRADGGSEDRGGGLVWRAQGPRDYELVRWNPREGNLRLYTVAAGQRTMLKSVDVATDPAAWHTLMIEANGPHKTVWFDGARRIDIDDATHRNGGRFGVWTKADAATSFDDVIATW